MARRVLCIWLPNWPCQRLRDVRNDPPTQPLVLRVRDPRRGWIVAAACSLARSYGVVPRMSLSEALAAQTKILVRERSNPGNRAEPICGSRSVSDSETEWIVKDHDAQEDLETLCQLAEAAQRFSPIVGLEPLETHVWAGRSLHQPQALLLDISGIGSLFGGEEALGHEVLQWLQTAGYQASIAIADTLGAAWGLAFYGHRLQKGISRHFFLQSSSCTLEEVLSDLPPIALRIMPDVAQVLERLGIRTIGQLLELPRSSLASRLGDALTLRIQQALGIVNEPLLALHAQPELCSELLLEYPTDRRDTVAELVKRLVVQLVPRLVQRGQGALRVLCRLSAVEAPPLVCQLGLFRPTADIDHLQKLLMWQFEQQWTRAIAINRISLQVTLAEKLVWRQSELFDSEGLAHRQSLAMLVDTLSSRLGRNQVVQAVIDGDPQPELSVSFRPLTGRRSSGVAQDTVRKLNHRIDRRAAEPLPHDPLRRPALLHSKPQRLDLIGVYPEGPPLQFCYRGQRHRIVQHWGPERIESGWWRGPSQRRDYYRVETEQGAWYWVFRDLPTGTWFLHGEYD